MMVIAPMKKMKRIKKMKTRMTRELIRRIVTICCLCSYRGARCTPEECIPRTTWLRRETCGSNIGENCMHWQRDISLTANTKAVSMIRGV